MSMRSGRKLLSNFFSLSAIQGLGFILPLVTFPYLVRVLGVENYGLVSFSLSVIMFFDILIEFGFNLSATKEISVHRNNPKKVAEIYASVMFLKLGLVAVSLLFFFAMIMFFDLFSENKLLYFVTFGLVIGNALFPLWFFQGMEKMKYIAYLHISTKLFFTVFIFILVTDSSDYLYVPALNTFGALMSGGISIWIVRKIFLVEFVFPTRKAVIDQFLKSYHFFLSRLANDGSRHYTLTMIGLYFGNTVVGYYAMVEKLLYAFMSLCGIVCQTIYPHMAKERDLRFYKKIFSLVVLSVSVGLIFSITIRVELLDFVFGVESELAADMFFIMFVGAFFGAISALLGYPLLAAYGYSRYANNTLIVAAVISALYVTYAAIVAKDIYLVVFSVVVYTCISAILRIYYVNKVKDFIVNG
ncbi:MAG: oligosaccharide flippase family protein [Gammaproteobacteria bacterium]|nr:oligosaccharide flippase family protein [Gammaproteobacteria bacterium]